MNVVGVVVNGRFLMEIVKMSMSELLERVKELESRQNTEFNKYRDFHINKFKGELKRRQKNGKY